MEAGEQDNKEKKGGAKKFGMGCLGLIAVLYLLGTLTEKLNLGAPEFKLEGDVAHVTVVVQSIYSLEIAAVDTAKIAYNVARQDKRIRKIVMTLMMSKAWLSDRYGKPIKEDLYMGTLVLDDAEDIRKYKDEVTYAFRDINKAYYMLTIKRMHHGYLLSQ